MGNVEREASMESTVRQTPCEGDRRTDRGPQQVRRAAGQARGRGGYGPRGILQGGAAVSGPLIAAGVLAAGQPSAKAPQAVSVAGRHLPETTCSARAEIPPMGTPSGVSAPGLALGDNAASNSARAPARDGSDPVNRPAHHNLHASGVECIDISEWLGGNLAQAFQYVWRHLHKGRPVEDLRKAQWYLRREIARRARVTGTFLPISDPGLYERWERVLQAEPCEQTAVVYRAIRLAHFGPIFDTDALDCALETISQMVAALAPEPLEC